MGHHGADGPLRWCLYVNDNNWLSEDSGRLLLDFACGIGAQMLRMAVVSVDMGFAACLNSFVTRVYD